MAAEDEVERVQQIACGKNIGEALMQENLLSTEVLDLPASPPDLRLIWHTIRRHATEFVDLGPQGVRPLPQRGWVVLILNQRQGPPDDPAHPIELLADQLGMPN